MTGRNLKNLAADYRELGSLRALAKCYGCSISTVRRRAVEAKVQLKPRGRADNPRYEAALAKEYFQGGKSLVQLAKERGISRQAVQQRLKLSGMTLRPRGRPRRKKAGAKP
jgi:transposase